MRKKHQHKLFFKPKKSLPIRIRDSKSYKIFKAHLIESLFKPRRKSRGDVGCHSTELIRGRIRTRIHSPNSWLRSCLSFLLPPLATRETQRQRLWRDHFPVASVIGASSVQDTEEMRAVKFNLLTFFNRKVGHRSQHSQVLQCSLPELGLHCAASHLRWQQHRRDPGP